MQRLPSTECEVILFGERLWPRADNATYDFDQLRAAVWYFRDLNNWLSGSRDGASVGIAKRSRSNDTAVVSANQRARASAPVGHIRSRGRQA